MAGHYPIYAMCPNAFRQAAEAMDNRYSDRGLLGRQLAKAQDLMPTMDMRGDIAVLELAGVMSKRPTFFTRLFGGTSTMELTELVRRAARDDSVRGIVLDVDSPGGDVAGTADLADAVHEAAQVKPVHAFISDLGASAAIWVASQARSITVNSTGEVGSIGVFATILDFSKALDEEGIKVHILRSTALKAPGHPLEAKTDAQLAEVQAIVDELHTLFVSAISRGRGISLKAAEHLADGRLHVGQNAVDVGLADAVGNLDDVVARALEHRPEDKNQSQTAKQATGAAPQGARDTVDTVSTDVPGVPSKQFDRTPPREEAATETAQDPTKEKTQMSDQSNAVTIKELKAAIPGAEADFYLEQVEKGATIEQAKDHYSDLLKAKNENLEKDLKEAQTVAVAKAKEPGNLPVGAAASEGEGTGASGDDYKAKVQELKTAGKSEKDATREARKAMPEAHRQYIMDLNPGRENLVEQFIGR